jgi:hypothetical protein
MKENYTTITENLSFLDTFEVVRTFCGVGKYKINTT